MSNDEAAYRVAARRLYPDLEIEDDAAVSTAPDGAFVAAWVWVPSWPAIVPTLNTTKGGTGLDVLYDIDLFNNEKPLFCKGFRAPEVGLEPTTR